MERTTEIAVVGGGPAGAYCGFELAKRGIYCTILDHSHPREKPCGGGITPVTIKKFPLLENFRSEGYTFGNFNLISCTNVQVIMKKLENGFRISRQNLDLGILNIATEKGAKLIKEKVIDVQKKGNLWILKTDKGLLKTNMLVGADGVTSLIRRRIIGPIPNEDLALTFGYFTTKIEKNRATIKFLGYIPGYIWVFPGRNNSNIGIGSELKYGSRLKLMLDKFVSEYYPDVNIISKFAAMVPSAKKPNFFRQSCAGENWILIGDAAGHVDPISGGGIIYALWGGKLAAEAISEKNPKSYDDKWKKEFGKKLEKSCKNKKNFYDPVKSTISIFEGLKNNIYSWS